MFAGILDYDGVWYVILTKFEVSSKNEAKEIVQTKLKGKAFPARIFPFDNWGDAAYQGNVLSDDFLTDWSMREYAYSAKSEPRDNPNRPEWKKRLAGLRKQC